MNNHYTFGQLEGFYKTDSDFKEYIDKMCQCRSISLKDALSYKISDEYAKYLQDSGESRCEEQKPTKMTTNIACGVNES